jgi:hypothetical protein
MAEAAAIAVEHLLVMPVVPAEIMLSKILANAASISVGATRRKISIPR